MGKTLSLSNAVDSFELKANHSIIEISVLEQFVGKTIKDIKLGSKYHLLALKTIKSTEVKSTLGKVEMSKRYKALQNLILFWKKMIFF